MPHKIYRQFRYPPGIPRFFKRKDCQQLINVRGDLMHATLVPSPELRADVINNARPPIGAGCALAQDFCDQPAYQAHIAAHLQRLVRHTSWDTRDAAAEDALPGHVAGAMDSDSAQAALWRELGDLYLRRGEAQRAREAFDKVLRLAPQDAARLMSALPAVEHLGLKKSR